MDSMTEFKENISLPLREIIDLPMFALEQELDLIDKDPKEKMLFNSWLLEGEDFAVREMLYFLKYKVDDKFIPADIPVHEDDIVRTEFALKFGMADIVIFHIDGTATVVEAKDGGNGYRAVVAGIGQASLYACQLGLAKGSIKEIRRAVCWNSAGDKEADDVISKACRLAGVVPVILPSRKKLSQVFYELLGDRRAERINFIARHAGFEDYLSMVNKTSKAVAELLSYVKAGM